MVGGAAFSMSHRRRQQATEYRVQSSTIKEINAIKNNQDDFDFGGTDRGQKFELKLETRTTTMG